MSNWLRVTICVMLVVSVLAMSLSVFAVDPSPEPTSGEEFINAVDEKLMSYYVWLCMRAWGIEISYQDSVEFNNYVEDEIYNWVIEFLETVPSVHSIAQWIAPWQSSFDYWGNYRFNESLLEDVQDFVDWLITQFGLVDNGVVVVDPIYSMNGYTIYDYDTYYRLYYPDGTYSDTHYAQMSYGAISDYSVGYVQVMYPDGDVYKNTYVALFTSQPAQRYYNNWKIIDPNGDRTQQGGSQLSNSVGPNSNGLYYQSGTGAQNNLHLSGNNPVLQSIGDLASFMSNASIVSEGDTKFLVSNINLPINDSGYTSGDSITIIGNEPQYEVIEWNGEVTVSNLPAVVSTGTIENPHLEEAYRPIQGLITYAKDGIGICQALLYELPDEMVYMWYGVIASIVVWGMIKLMREH